MDSLLLINAVATWTLLIVNFMLTLALIRRFNNSFQSSVVEGDGGQRSSPDLLSAGYNAPDFAAETLDGNHVKRSSLQNKTCILAVVSSSCPPCKNLVERLEAMKSTMSSLDLELLLVGIDSSDGMQKFVEETRTTFPVVVAPRTTNSFAEEYKIQGTPTIYVLDAKGNVKWAGFPDIFALDKLISRWAS
jgi:peroxiredoxin